MDENVTVPEVVTTMTPTDPPTNDTMPVMMDDGIIEMNTWWPMGMPFPDEKAEVNDTIIFSWSEGFEHNVYMSLDGTCDGAVTADDNDDGGNRTVASTLIGDVSPVSYTIGEEHAGKNITFICTIEDHCVNGQIITFHIDALMETTPDETDMPTSSLTQAPSSSPPVEPASPSPVTSVDEIPSSVDEVSDGSVPTAAQGYFTAGVVVLSMVSGLVVLF